jgi:hypothetical protein
MREIGIKAAKSFRILFMTERFPFGNGMAPTTPRSLYEIYDSAIPSINVDSGRIVGHSETIPADRRLQT